MRFFFAAGLSKAIIMKNKKMLNVISFILIINFISKNKPPTQNLTKMAKICLKTALERRRVKQMSQKYLQNKQQPIFNPIQLCLLRYRTRKR